MTDATTTEAATEAPELDTAPGNTSPDRALRHEISALIHRGCGALRGEAGLSQEQQVERATYALMAAEAAVEKLNVLRTLLVNRDFEKFQATRDRDAEQAGESNGGGFIGFLVVGGSGPDDDGDDSDD